jgi:hypothetical protein
MYFIIITKKFFLFGCHFTVFTINTDDDNDGNNAKNKKYSDQDISHRNCLRFEILFQNSAFITVKQYHFKVSKNTGCVVI